jgi:hypothetical protein
MEKIMKEDILKTAKIYLWACDDYMGVNNKYSEKLKLYIDEIYHLESVARYGAARICSSKHILKSEWSYIKHEFPLDNEMLSDLIDLIYKRLDKFCNEEVEPLLNVFRDNDTKSNI